MRTWTARWYTNGFVSLLFSQQATTQPEIVSFIESARSCEWWSGTRKTALNSGATHTDISLVQGASAPSPPHARPPSNRKPPDDPVLTIIAP